MKDLRKDFNYSDEELKMPKGHFEAFQRKLGVKSSGKSSEGWIQRIAAILIIGILISTYWFQNDSTENNSDALAEQKVDLKDISPELDNLATYFEASINYELATLDYGDYEDVAFSYLDELKTIEKDYEILQQDLRTSGFDEMIIEAMIENLQLRLELLQNLKLKLNQLKTLNHEKSKPEQL